MIDIKDYYDEVLSKFNFSISGYADIKRNLNDFFESFVNSRSLIGENHIDFISYGYSKLVDLDNWKLESTHKNDFFFNTFNERSSELLMVHEYYAFKQFLISKCNEDELLIDFSDKEQLRSLVEENNNIEISNYLTHAGDKDVKKIISDCRIKNGDENEVEEYDIIKYKLETLRTFGFENELTTNDILTVRKVRTSELAAKIFRKPTIYRIALIQEGHLEVRFDKHLGVLTIRIPYRELFSDEYIKTRNELHKLFEEELLKSDNNSKHQLLFTKNNNLYTKVNRDYPYLFIESLEILNPETVKRTVNVLSKKLISLNNRSEDKFLFDSNELKQNLLISSFSKLLISHAYLSYLFNCWVENIPGVVDVDENNGDQRCLGTFIVGYNMGQEISDSERMIFQITSDRISANLASNTIDSVYPNIKLDRARNKQVNFLKNFKKDLHLYYNSRNDNPEKPIHTFDLDVTREWISDYFQERKTLMVDCGLGSMAEYFNEIAEGEKCHIALLTEMNDLDSKYPKLSEKNSIYTFLSENDRSQIIHNNNQTNRSFVNIITPHYLVNELRDRTKEEGIKIKTEGSFLFIECKMKKEDSHFQNIIDKLNKNNPDSGLTTFLRKYWNDILILGNIEIGVYEELEILETEEQSSTSNNKKSKSNKFLTKIDMKKDFKKKNECLVQINEKKIEDSVSEVVWKVNFYSI